MDDQSEQPTRNAYRTRSSFQTDQRRLLLKGGRLDGKEWQGVIAVGARVFCGDGAWAPSAVYLVTDQQDHTADGHDANVAVPAFADDAP